MRLLEKWSQIPVGRITYIPDAGPDTIEGIDRGIVFHMAFWSIYSIQAFVALTKVMARMSVERLELVVIDVDEADQLASIPDFKERLSTGAGETFWLRHGKIVAKSLNPLSDLECFETSTTALLSMP